MSTLNPQMRYFNSAIIDLRDDIAKITAIHSIPLDLYNLLHRTLSQFRQSYEDITYMSPPDLGAKRIVGDVGDWHRLKKCIEQFGLQCTCFVNLLNAFKQKYPYLDNEIELMVLNGVRMLRFSKSFYDRFDEATRAQSILPKRTMEA